MTSIVIANTPIRQDADGRFCINDLHKAAGGAPKQKPANWLQHGHTRELAHALQLENDGIPSIVTKRGRYGGSFVSKELVYWYASWVSPDFHIQVIRAYDALARVAEPEHVLPKTMADALRLAADLTEANERLEQRVAADAPKVEFHDAVAEDAGSLTFREVAKVHGLSDRQLSF